MPGIRPAKTFFPTRVTQISREVICHTVTLCDAKKDKRAEKELLNRRYTTFIPDDYKII